MLLRLNPLFAANPKYHLSDFLKIVGESDCGDSFSWNPYATNLPLACASLFVSPPILILSDSSYIEEFILTQLLRRIQDKERKSLFVE